MTNTDVKTAQHKGEDFMQIEDHFKAILNTLSIADRAIYDSFKNTRQETAYKSRHFIVYRMVKGEPELLDRLRVMDFEADEEQGASTQIYSKANHQTQVISYAPTLMFNYKLFMWMPLQVKLRWSAQPSSPLEGKLGFPIAIRTAGRLSFRDPGVTYCETGPVFGAEFGNIDSYL